MPGCPDIVFASAKIAVFCDGDFWHGRDWAVRREKLSRGANPAYWTAKIERNMARDAVNQEKLERSGWRVLRFWESEIRADPAGIAAEIGAELEDSGAGFIGEGASDPETQ